MCGIGTAQGSILDSPGTLISLTFSETRYRSGASKGTGPGAVSQVGGHAEDGGRTADFGGGTGWQPLPTE